MNVKKNTGQVWIETVLYTVIGLAIIALVLSFAYPKIRASQESLLIEQSIATMNNLDTVITTVNERGPGNIKTYTFSIKRGRLIFKEKEETVSLVLTGIKSLYSEPGVAVQDGRVSVLTREGTKGYTVELLLNYTYSDSTGSTRKLVDLKVGDPVQEEEIKEFVQAATPYVISVSYGKTPGSIVIEEGVSAS
jgi:membrane-associated protease RseP (regulator of RpoE activity)